MIISFHLPKGRPGMEQWRILVLGTLRVALGADFDRIQELANEHRTLRMMLGHGTFDDKNYRLQTLRDNLKLFTLRSWIALILKSFARVISCLI